ncbi:MAG: hypothetical protein QW680_07935 [Pyrobaculum sp.]
MSSDRRSRGTSLESQMRHLCTIIRSIDSHRGSVNELLSYCKREGEARGLVEEILWALCEFVLKGNLIFLEYFNRRDPLLECNDEERRCKKIRKALNKILNGVNPRRDGRPNKKKVRVPSTGDLTRGCRRRRTCRELLKALTRMFPRDAIRIEIALDNARFTVYSISKELVNKLSDICEKMSDSDTTF